MSVALNNPKKQSEKFIMEPIETVDGEMRIKKYLKLKVVGSGSYSKCFLVKNADSESTYVVKVIPKKKLEILQKQKLIYEIKIHQSLLHPNVVHLDHWFEDESHQYIFMEYCPNGNLEMKLVEGGLDEKEIRRCSQQIVEALKYIHSQNILHRDLKLCNFYLDENDNVKLGDFGFACQLASEYDRKRQTCGTPNYIAPQAISGFGYSFSSDVWAVGVILYRLKYGFCPFEGDTVKRTLQNVKICNYKFPSKPKISPQLKDLIQKIFDLNYDDRLTTGEILMHKFYDDGCHETFEAPQKETKIQKRGFSLTRLFSRDSNKKEEKKKQSKQQPRGRQNLMQRESRNETLAKKEQPKRSNSCQTFKQIKQIFKNKSKQNLATTGNLSKRDPSPSPYYTMNTITSQNFGNKQQHTLNIKSGRTSMMEYSYSMSFSLNQTHADLFNNSKKDARDNRLNQFIKTQVNSISLKDQLKQNRQSSSKAGEGQNSKVNPDEQQKLSNLHVNSLNNSNLNSNISKPPLGTLTPQQKKNQGPSFQSQPHVLKISKSSSSAQSALNTYCKRYSFPYLIQQEKDVTIIHYKISLKQVIYGNICLVMHNNPGNLFKISGESFDGGELPKILRFILENKVEIREEDQEESEPRHLDRATGGIGGLLQLLPQTVNVMKDGVILKYAHYSSLICAKIFAQQGYCIMDENSQTFLFTVGADGVAKILEGVVVLRIYSGWIKTHIKK